MRFKFPLSLNFSHEVCVQPNKSLETGLLKAKRFIFRFLTVTTIKFIYLQDRFGRSCDRRAAEGWILITGADTTCVCVCVCVCV